MLNIILVIIAIALIGALVITSIWYGGESYSEGKIAAEATRYRTEAQQIAGAVTLYKAQGNEISDAFRLQDLVDLEYLKALPEDWEPGDNKIMRVLPSGNIESENICYVANEQSGFSFSSSEEDVKPYSQNIDKAIPYCNKDDLNRNVPCCIEVSA